MTLPDGVAKSWSCGISPPPPQAFATSARGKAAAAAMDSAAIIWNFMVSSLWLVGPFLPVTHRLLWTPWRILGVGRSIPVWAGCRDHRGESMTTHETGGESSAGAVTVSEAGSGTYTQQITVGHHRLVADEPRP